MIAPDELHRQLTARIRDYGPASLLDQVSLRELFETADTAVFCKDRNSVFYGCNQLFANYAGLAASDVAGRSDSDMPWGRDHGASYLAWDQRIIDTGGGAAGIREPIRVADGSIRWLHTNKSPLHGADGEVLGIMGSFVEVDGTDRSLSVPAATSLPWNDRGGGFDRSAGSGPMQVELNKIVNALVDDLRSMLPIDLVAVFLTDPDGEHHVRRYSTADGFSSGGVRRSETAERNWLRDLRNSGQSVDSITRGPGFRAGTTVVLADVMLGGQVIGGILVQPTNAGAPSDGVEHWLRQMAKQVAAAMQMLRSSESTVSYAIAREREIFARDLHDTAVQDCYSIQLLSESALTALDLASPAHVAMERIRDAARLLQLDLRNLLGPRPIDRRTVTPSLSEVLHAAVERLRSTSPFPIDASLEVVEDVPEFVAMTFFHVAQEALFNAIRHSRASQVSVTMVRSPELQLVVSDDGVGFDPTKPIDGHYGLSIMAGRARDIGATLRVESALDAGTTVTLTE